MQRYRESDIYDELEIATCHPKPQHNQKNGKKSNTCAALKAHWALKTKSQRTHKFDQEANDTHETDEYEVESLPSIHAISTLNERKYNKMDKFYNGTTKLDHQYYPQMGKWISINPPLLENTAVGTAGGSRTFTNMDQFEKKKERLPIKHRSTITLCNGVMKEMKDAANLVVLCPKHMHRLAVPLIHDKDKIFKAGMVDNVKIRSSSPTKESIFSTGTQVSMITPKNPQAVQNIYQVQHSPKDFSTTKDICPFEDNSDSSGMCVSISSYEDLSEQQMLSPQPAWYKRGTAETLKQHIFNVPDDNYCERDLDMWSAQLVVDDKRAFSNKLPSSNFPTFAKTDLHPPQSRRKNYNLCSDNSEMAKYQNYNMSPLVPGNPTLRRSSGMINYDNTENDNYLISDSFKSTSGLSNFNTSSPLYSKTPDRIPTFTEDAIDSSSRLTSRTSSIPPVFKDSSPKCSKHQQVNCKSSICREKSSYLLRRQNHYEAIMDQVHYIKSRIKTLNFTLRDVELLFKLIEKANDDLLTKPCDPKERILARKNKTKYESFHKKVISNQTETQFTLETIIQLEELFDTVLMNIELCEKKFELKEDKHRTEDHLQFNLIELEENMHELEFLRNCKKGWIHEQILKLDELQEQLFMIQNWLKVEIFS